MIAQIGWRPVTTGTSTGGIIAIGLGMGLSSRREIRKLYGVGGGQDGGSLTAMLGRAHHEDDGPLLAGGSIRSRRPRCAKLGTAGFFRHVRGGPMARQRRAGVREGAGEC